MKDTKYAAVALCFNDEGKVLLVTRPNKPNEYGIVGGKVDSDETTFHAAIRELKEETGYIGNENKQILVYSDWCHGEQDYYVATYLIEIIGQGEKDLDQLEFGLEHIWADFKVSFRGPFADYNRKLAQVLLTDYKDYLNENIIIYIKSALQKYICSPCSRNSHQFCDTDNCECCGNYWK